MNVVSIARKRLTETLALAATHAPLEHGMMQSLSLFQRRAA